MRNEFVRLFANAIVYRSIYIRISLLFETKFYVFIFSYDSYYFIVERHILFNNFILDFRNYANTVSVCYHFPRISPKSELQQNAYYQRTLVRQEPFRPILFSPRN